MGSQRPLTPRAPTPLDAVIRTRLDQRSMDDQRQREAERGHAQRRCRFEANAAATSNRGRQPLRAKSIRDAPGRRTRVLHRHRSRRLATMQSRGDSCNP